MKKLIFVFAAVSSICVSAFAQDPVQLSGEPARKLFGALVQADLKTTEIDVLVDPNSPELGYEVVDQKVAVSNLSCKMAYTGVGTLTGSCSVTDVYGNQDVQLGSAASAQIMGTLPDGFADGATGHFTGSAASISCEIDARQTDSTGTAVATCSVQ